MNELFTQAYTKIVAKAWSDAEFKKRLLSDPNAVLKENGIEIPQGVQFKVMEDTNQLVHLVLPHPSDELTLDELGNAAGGAAKKAIWRISL
jgi:hypothetical protein